MFAEDTNCLPNEIPHNHSLYVIYLQITKECHVSVGKLGKYSFPAGLYLYIGSAKRNIRARLTRHLQVNKKHRWHFDYVRPYGQIVKVETYARNISECQLRSHLQESLSGKLLVKGFGSSDCKCDTHLIFVP